MDEHTHTTTPLTGHLLVASPGLADPNFHLTVVLVLEHEPGGGALGVVLNRPSEVPVAVTLPTWRELAAEPGVVFVGGPVGQEAAIGLARAESMIDPAVWRPVLGPVGVLDLSRDAGDVGTAIERLRVFLGHSGWGPGQLEAELAQGAWFVVPADPGDVFADDPQALWRTVLARQGGIFRSVSPDPTQN